MSIPQPSRDVKRPQVDLSSVPRVLTRRLTDRTPPAKFTKFAPVDKVCSSKIYRWEVQTPLPGYA
ncbi:hypothetical protein N656DRAFT_780814 [Canariomyces notabilis]|uniref:Uncharacterized protein n=1 Tax=Canariomyces notabilis TaxID=2074819 RepID=A0AAN6TAX7_9PEZI|nr:hypothetical protein N656DRAFT_780814 [Canariomyces arenarius]